MPSLVATGAATTSDATVAPVVGAPPQWGDGSDATYSTTVWKGYVDTTNTGTGYPTSTTLDPYDAGPSVDSVTFNLRARVRSVSPAGLAPRNGLVRVSLIGMFGSYLTAAKVDAAAFPIGAPGTVTLTAPALIDPTHLAQTIASGALVLVEANPSFIPAGEVYDEQYVDVYEFALSWGDAPPPAPYVPPALAHPSLRMLQRGGSGGMAGIPRMVGNPTVRGSLRRGPGSVY